MKRPLLFLIIALCVLSSGCRPQLVTPRHVVAVLDDVETYINERPDSALVVLRALDSTAVRSRALRARAALLHSIALDKNYIDLKTDSILAPAVFWYSRHGSPDEKLKTRYYLGRLQYNAKNYQEAIVTYTEALEMTAKAKDLKYVGFVNQAIADTYCITNVEQEAIPYLLDAKRCFDQSGNEELSSSTQYKLATVYATEELIPQSDSLFKDLSHRDLPGWLRMRVLSDYGLFLVAHANDTRAAIHYFEQALAESGTLLSSNHWAAYAYALSTEGQEQKSNI
ncbi:MAG: hypothetical protein K6G86_02250 [Bacteroidales bacterium]|nr:hypothetical protein [Bacteroidales bacterium]